MRDRLDPYEIDHDIFPVVPELDSQDETWMKYHIRDYPEELGVTVFVSTNDNLDTGFPGEYAQWENHYKTLAEALERIGITDESTGNYVWLNGDPVRDRDIERHKKRIEVVKRMKKYTRAFDAALNNWDVGVMLGSLIALHEDLVPYLEEERAKSVHETGDD